MKIQFFTTLGCHLCEQAEHIIAELQQNTRSDLFVESIDIADDDELVERYGIRIPVVKRLDIESDLGWPFGKAELEQYLRTP